MCLFLILLDGRLVMTPRLRRQVQGARVIAADGGIRHAMGLGVTPEFWLGDFDSTNDELRLLHQQVPQQSFPADKDVTDGELALREALRRGASRLIIAGALGGRSDHVLAHLGLSLRLEEQGVSVLLTSGDEEAYALLEGSMRLDAEPGDRLSLVPWTALAGLTLSGVKWPLSEAGVKLGSTLTLSNSVTGPVQISLSQGQGVVFLAPAGRR